MTAAPDMAARADLARDASAASRTQALASQASPGQKAAPPAKAFGKILDSLTPEKAQAAGLGADEVKTLTSQAMNKRLNPGPSEEKKLQEACEGFESVFIAQMLKEMRKTIPKDGLLTSKYEEQYVSMFDEELSKTLAKQGGMGLASFMRDQLAARTSAGASAQPHTADGGLRMSAQQGLALPGRRKAPAGLRGGALKALPAPGALGSGPETVLAADSPGGKAQPSALALAGALSPPPGTRLDGLPSQRAGLPGADYLAGADASPVEGGVTSEYGWRRDPFTGRRAWHAGTDIAAPEGTPVKAVRDGTVVFSGRQGGYGNLVVVEHEGGVRTYYGHNRQNSVAEGQGVKAGQVIAAVGQTGRATGPHLHFEVRVDGEAVDPSKLGRTTFAAAPQATVPVPEL